VAPLVRLSFAPGRASYNRDMLLGREQELRELAAALSGARENRSGVLVLTGEPGIGKTALVDHVAALAGDAGMRILRARGIESEARVPFAGLLDLLRPALGSLDRIPGPQAAALEGALALRPASAQDRFAVGAATLSLLAAYAEQGPVAVLLDDVHWLDQSSSQALLFAFRRLVADPIAAAEFYEQVLGFGVSDWVLVPGMGRLGAFMHCNTRHHSFAFFANPEPRKKIHHIMMEYTSIDDVGTAYDLCLERDLVTATLGRHLNDHMFSFYFKNPGDWHFELGWGAREIDPATWQVEHYNGLQPGGGEWGHKGLFDVM